MSTTRTLIVISSIAFFFNLIWENAQAPLFQGYQNFWQHLPACLQGSVGDVVIVLLIYVFIALVYKNILWIKQYSGTQGFLAIGIGTLVGALTEYLMLQLGRWKYTDEMPLVPLIEIGLTPLLQMLFLPALIFYTAYITIQHYENNNL